VEGHLVKVPRANIDSLTGLRFIAAASIALGHTDAKFDILTLIGMPLFFTLSGFVIHYVYSEEFTRNWHAAIPEFALARFSRIYPLYFCLFLFALVSTPLGGFLFQKSHISLSIPYLLFCYTWWPFAADGKPLGDWYYGISWSIPTEMFFYFAYALVFYKIERIKEFRTCLLTLMAFCIFAYAWFYALFYYRDIWEPEVLSYQPTWLSRTQNFNDSFYRWFLYTSPYSRIFEFIGGCLTCQLFLLARRRPALSRPILEGLAWLALAAIAAVLFAVSVTASVGSWLATGNHSWSAYLINLHMNFLLAPMCYALFFSLALGAPFLGRALGSPVPRFLGDISYSIYLAHPIAQTFSNSILGISTGGAKDLLIMGIILLLAWALYTTIEVPAKSLLRGLGAAYILSTSNVSKKKSSAIAAATSVPAEVEPAI
jgi:peptidoglycan/LPS O-acetylase OafA/YrhL